MNPTETSQRPAHQPTLSARGIALSVLCLLLFLLIAAMFINRRGESHDHAVGTQQADATPIQLANFEADDVTSAGATDAGNADRTELLELPESRWEVSGIQLRPVERGAFETTVRLTGKVSLNQDRVAHIYPMVEGIVESVSVGLGQQVKAGQLLATIHSREIGEAKLKLFQSRLQLEMATAKHEMQTEIANNVRDLVKALRERMPIEQIEVAFRSRPMGEYRERLLTAYSSYTKSQADVSRLQGIANSGAVSGKTLLSAEANRNADQATFQSRLEEVEHGLRMSSLLSSQLLKETETQAAVAETTLHILGVRDEELKKIDPAEQGEGISHYLLRAPFDGTVLTKDVVLSEQVRPDVMLLSIADLSTVWILTDLYQEHIPLLASLAGQTIHLHSESWPDQTFEAEVFFAGETMDESTRTISMRAIADNAEHLLKPGMFVTVDLSAVTQQDVLQVPLTAIQEHEGQKFVFIHRGEAQFERRNVRVGTANERSITIKQGLEPDESVVVQGGFILKSQMLADLMGEE
ncbi:Cobalt-zinc-cadmium resistance protein CzcB [Rosistilla carotiformis]|uniref:Cobalt-zinc-cadmium resistance protein CzcB n=1 Tax=Rosistilla carotiformis TaxID=2528017 RepID=A0A518JM78_9BACT|nr:efflux RND transporter periplasmic adaptor subunit [Rosistilla carotiformis]QDV66653.1 Cobalt-zinc-cadmium resistance protein CzcB [Rosistilla carotiformis]